MDSTMQNPENVETLANKIFKLENLATLNLSGIPLTNPACAHIRDFLIKSDNIKNLNLANCKI